MAYSGFRGQVHPVPKILCQIIEREYDSSQEHHFYFSLAQKIISAGGCANIPREELKLLPGAKNKNDFIAELVRNGDRLFDVGTYHFGMGSGRCRPFYFKLDLLEAIEEEKDYYLTWADYKNYRRYVNKPFPFSQDLFLRLGGGVKFNNEPGLLEAIEKLQARPLHFDHGSAIKDPTIRFDSELAREAKRFPSGAIFAIYRLQQSGRVGTFSPNLQGIRKELRRFIRPPEGYQHLYFDYKAQEPRLIAHLAQDQAMNSMLIEGDFYQTIFGALDLDRKLPELHADRGKVKRVINSILYGQEAFPLASELFAGSFPSKDKIRAASDLIGGIKELFPEVFNWISELTTRIILEDQAESVGGTIRTRFERCKDGRIKFRDARCGGVNHVVQGTGADIMRKLIVALDRELTPYNARLVLPIHDGVLVEVPDKSKAQVESVVLTLMKDLPRLLMPEIFLPVDGPKPWHS